MSNFPDIPTATTVNNNHQQSNFKRQNTVDTATIKENTARIIGSRPATATTPNSKPIVPIMSPIDPTSKIATQVFSKFKSFTKITIKLICGTFRVVNPEIPHH